MRIIKWLKKKINRTPKAILLDNTFRIIPAFTWHGITYYMHEDPLNTATGRGLTALVFMEELLMRCSVNFLKNHVEAIEKILSDPKKINIGNLARLNQNLKERVNFLTAVPAHVFKLASIVFFTKEESAFRYDEAYNRVKIKEWEKDKSMYAFFLQQTQLKDSIPFLKLPAEDSQTYLTIQQKINTMHLKELAAILSKTPLTIENLN